MVLDARVQSEFSLLASLGLVGCIKGGETQLVRCIAATCCGTASVLLDSAGATLFKGDGAVWLTGVDLATLPRSWGSPVIETGAPLPTRNIGGDDASVVNSILRNAMADRPIASGKRGCDVILFLPCLEPRVAWRSYCQKKRKKR